MVASLIIVLCLLLFRFGIYCHRVYLFWMVIIVIYCYYYRSLWMIFPYNQIAEFLWLLWYCYFSLLTLVAYGLNLALTVIGE